MCLNVSYLKFLRFDFVIFVVKLFAFGTTLGKKNPRTGFNQTEVCEDLKNITC